MRPRRRDAAPRTGGSGFTLVELLVVIAILGVLAAIVAFTVSGVHDRGGDAACRTDVGTVQVAVDAYRNDHADATTGAPGPVPVYARLGQYIRATPHSCAHLDAANPDDGAPAIGSDGTVTGILPSDGHTRVP
ncbi:MAG: ral secretion pathway protein [Chloroflexota bacterium]|nr:ral secretion pathway protein [Chloroflexota bacterium]